MIMQSPGPSDGRGGGGGNSVVTVAAEVLQEARKGLVEVVEVVEV
jgi:hypothetical protein